MITLKRIEKKGGFYSGERVILSTKYDDSSTLRHTFLPNLKYRNTHLSKVSYLLLKSSSYITSLVQPFQDMTISQKWLFCKNSGFLVVQKLLTNKVHDIVLEG